MNFFRKLILIFFALLLTGCGGVLSVQVDPGLTPAQLPTQVVTLMPGMPQLNMQSDSETIRQALLNSPSRWNQLWVSGLLIDYASNGDVSQSQAFQAWIEQPGARFRLLMGAAESTPGMVQISDGQNITRVTLPDGQREQQPLPEDARAPFSPPAEVSDSIIPHPLGSLMDTPANPVFFPTGLAQRGGEYRPVELTEQAGRPALVVEWQHDGQVLDHLWIDTLTGHLLRWQSHGKGVGQVVLEVVVNQIAYDAPFDAALFDPQLSIPPAYVQDVRGGVTPSPRSPVSVFSPGGAQLYFNILRRNSGPHLGRLPSTCVSGAEACLSPAIVPSYPNVNSSIEPLSWSPDGTLAAMVMPDPATGRMKLWRYHPSDESWLVLIDMPTVSGPVVWSPEGDWLAFTVTNDAGKEIVFAMHNDGSDPHDLTGGTLPSEDAHLSPVAWIDNSRLVFLYIDKLTAELYSVSTDKQWPVRLNDLELQRGVVALSPNRQQLAYTGQGEHEDEVLWQSGLDGANPNRLFSLQNASIQQVQWSPQGDWIAFFTLNSAEGSMASSVFIIRPDGSDLRQLYNGPSLGRLTFIPDAPYLLLEDNQRMDLLVVPVAGGPAVTLSAPGIELDDQLMGISWRALGQ